MNIDTDKIKELALLVNNIHDIKSRLKVTDDQEAQLDNQLYDKCLEVFGISYTLSKETKDSIEKYLMRNENNFMGIKEEELKPEYKNPIVTD